MPRDKKQRIVIEAASKLQTNPFATLDLQGRNFPQEGRDTRPACPPPSHRPGAPPGPAAKERLLLRRSTAHRGGKTVLILDGFSPAWATAKLESLLHELKSSLGCGGKMENRTLELQGELTDRLLPLLEARGFAVRRGW